MLPGSVQPVCNTFAGGDTTNDTDDDDTNESGNNNNARQNLFYNSDLSNFLNQLKSGFGSWLSNFNANWTSYVSRSNSNNGNAYAGLNTGFCLSLSSGPSVLRGFVFSTSNDDSNSDPVNVTIEGTNSTNLNLGSNWKLLYKGSCGLDTDPGRQSDGSYQSISNSVPCKSYRILVTSKRGSSSNCVSYSRVKLYN